MFYTYVLLCSDNKQYIGCCSNLRDRITKHKQGQVLSTRNRRPVKLIYYEACLDKVKSYKREAYFKSGYGRRFLKSRI